MIGIIIALAVMGVAFTTTAVIMGIKIRNLNNMIAMLTMIVAEKHTFTHIVKDGNNIYDISFPDKEGF